jgi:hypothetical protein
MPDLQETQHQSFRLPANKDISIWRYMDLGKYLSMLDRRSLFFARASLLGDPFEDAPTKLMVTQREYIKRNRGNDPTLAAYKDVPEEALDWGDIFKGLVGSYLVNCWHMNEHESAAMWKLYSNSNEAVCIRSTYRRLRQCLPLCLMVGEVNYINYETQGFSVDMGFNFITHKRLSFSHELELRAILWERAADARPFSGQIGPSGLNIEVDLSALVERVYVSPTAAPWLGELVGAMTRKCGYAFPVSQSALAEAPLH